ncbi:alpha-amylase family glycosyl hydrolase [Bacteroidota bacterium]
MYLRKYFFKLFLRPISLLIIIGSFTSCAQDKTSADQLKVVHTDWSKNATIYEVNIRQYTPEGTFKAFEQHLPRLKEMGIDILWLMPINPIGDLNRKGILGSYYAVKDYKGVNPEFGTLEDFKSLVNKIHELDMYVILDWVANHTAWDNIWTETNPEFFSKDSTGNFYPPVADWSDVIDLNYDNKLLWKFMIDAMKYWVAECNVDGYRCDVAAMVPTELWNQARKELDQIKSVFMLAEAGESFLHDKAFDMTYNWPLKDLMNAIAKGEKNASDIRAYYENEKTEYDIDAYRMTFTSNHDENTWHGTVFERLGDAAEMFSVLTCTVKGVPLVYSGQEAGLDKRLDFFEKDQIEWKDHKFYDLYKTLFTLKHDNTALWNGAAGGEMDFILSDNDKSIFVFSREKLDDKIVAVFNVSNNDMAVKLSGPELIGNYIELFSNVEFNFTSDKAELSLEPWGYLVFVKE